MSNDIMEGDSMGPQLTGCEGEGQTGKLRYGEAKPPVPRAGWARMSLPRPAENHHLIF